MPFGGRKQLFKVHIISWTENVGIIWNPDRTRDHGLIVHHKLYARQAVVLAQLVERSLSTPENLGSNPVIDKFYLL